MLFVGSRWPLQPPARVGANPARGLSALWALSGRADRVSGAPIVIGTGGTIVTTPGGTALSVSGTTNLSRGVLVSARGADKPGAGDFTVFARYYLRTVAGFCIIGRWNTGASPSTNDWLLGSATGIASTISFGGAFGSNIVHAEVAAGSVANEEYFMVGRRRGTTLYVDRVHLVRGLPDEAWASASNTSVNVTTFNSNTARVTAIGEIAAGAGNNTSLDLLVAGMLPYALSDEQVRRLPYDIWDYFRPRRIWVPVAAAAGDITVGLTGQAASATAGALAPSAAKALVGESAAAAAGTLSPAASMSLTGAAATAAAGTLAPTSAKAISGQAASAAAGTVAPATTLGLAGQAATAATGFVTVPGDVTLALTGISMSANAGTLAPATARALSGSALVTASGTLTLGIVVPMSGTTASAQPGTLTASGGGQPEAWVASRARHEPMGTGRARPPNLSTRKRS